MVKERDQVSPSLASICKWPNKHPVPTASAILFFKIILRKTLEDGKLKLPSSFTRKYGGGLSNPVFLNLPDGSEWEVCWTKHDAEILLEKGWKEFATYYSLDHGHLVLFEYKESAHFDVHIFGMSGLQIEYPFHESLDQISDEAAETIDEMPPTQNNKLKSPMLSSPQPCKKPRIGTSEDVRASYNVQNLLQSDQINGNQSQRTNLEKSTFASGKKKLDEDIGGVTQCPKVEQLTKVTEALNKAKTFSSRNPFFMKVMEPSYANSDTLSLPFEFAEEYLKNKQGVASFLQVQDGRTWSVIHSLGRFYSGWKKFVLENNLNVGDICVFELTDRKVLSFRVSIFRAAEEPSCSLSQATGDGVNLLDPGRVQNVDVDSKADTTIKGRKATQRISMVIDPGCSRNGAKKEAEKFTSENPFFIVSIKRRFLGPRRPNVPAAFIKKYLISNEKQILTFQFGNKIWRVKLLCYAYSAPCRFSEGWPLFAKENELQAGDVCVFELINRQGAVFDVHIFRCHHY